MIDDIVWAGLHVIAQCVLEANGNMEVLVRGMTWEETVAASGFLGVGYSCAPSHRARVGTGCDGSVMLPARFLIVKLGLVGVLFGTADLCCGPDWQSRQ